MYFVGKVWKELASEAFLHEVVLATTVISELSETLQVNLVVSGTTQQHGEQIIREV